RSGQQLACLLWLGAGFSLLLMADLYQFSWRYQLVMLVTFPPAAALGLSALTAPRTARELPVPHEPDSPGDSGPAGPDDQPASHQPGGAGPGGGRAHTGEPAEPAEPPP